MRELGRRLSSGGCRPGVRRAAVDVGGTGGSRLGPSSRHPKLRRPCCGPPLHRTPWCCGTGGAVVAAIAAAGCSDDRSSGAELSDTTTTVDEPSLISGAGCRPPTPVTSSTTGLVEARGTGTEVVAWALFWVEPPWKPHQRVKVVWRMRGRGDLAVVARGPAGETVGPSSGGVRMKARTGNGRAMNGERSSPCSLPGAGFWKLHAANTSPRSSCWSRTDHWDDYAKRVAWGHVLLGAHAPGRSVGDTLGRVSCDRRFRRFALAATPLHPRRGA